MGIVKQHNARIGDHHVAKCYTTKLPVSLLEVSTDAWLLLVLVWNFKVGTVRFALEERFVKPVDTHVTVLTTASVRSAQRVDGKRVDGTKVTRETSAFLFKHLVPETRLKLALARASRRDTHSLLTTPHNHVGPRRVRNGRVKWRVSCVCFLHFKRCGINQVR